MSLNIPYFHDWPKVKSKIKVDPEIERKIRKIVRQMTLEEKVGQMIQPEVRQITPEEVKKYKIGSILNGGGAWPNDNKYASAAEWASKADEFWYATQEMYEKHSFKIPFMWATDAVHGHNNVFGATVFPHNIGLGCARDPQLIRRIGRVTAIEIAATGLDWTFAPTVATPRDLRWGRVYEGYSEDPEIVYQYASEMVKGLQGDAEDLKSESHVISNVKHWVGDGGTTTGIDRGINHYSEDLLRNIHAMGYFSGLDAGAQVVMTSFNSWENEVNYDHCEDIGATYNHKIHGSKYLITDVLKEKMGFDGLVVTDWHGHAEVSKCSDGNATYAINAGNDILMIPVRENWQAVYANTLQAVKEGAIATSRIDDAVSRILRVKMRANLWEKPAPTQRKFGGDDLMLGCPKHRALAREAVRKSLVLLKNKNELLPLERNQKVILTGSAANDIQKQSGGWNLTWQGDENQLSDFPGATTLKLALEQELGEHNVVHDPELKGQLTEGSIAIVAFGEDPYAEMMGDIKEWQTLEFSKLKRSYAKDCAHIRKLHEAGVKIISVFFSGRPLYVNQEISLSDAFVAAFLPGSEGCGITDLLLRDENNTIRHDFVGKLSFSWPNKKCSTTVNRIPPHIVNYDVPENEQSPWGEHAPLFEFGYGLNYASNKQNNNLDMLELDVTCGVDSMELKRSEYLYGIRSTVGDYQLRLADCNKWVGVDVSRNNVTSLTQVTAKPYNYQQQQDAIEVVFSKEGGCVFVRMGDGIAEDFSHYYENGVIEFEIKLLAQSSEPIHIAVKKAHQFGEQNRETLFDISAKLKEKTNEFVKVSVPSKAIANNSTDLRHLDTPFVLSSSGSAEFVLANICWTYQ
jgi:beta-glucosidase